MMCPECGAIFFKDMDECPNCGLKVELQTHAPSNTKPTSLWYLVAIFFGILGGLIGYVAVKDEDKGMAEALLALGVIMTIVAVFAVWWATYALTLSF